VPDFQFLVSDPAAACGSTRGKRGRVRCELPPDHVLGRNAAPFTVDWHTGRGRDGRWITWKAEAPSA